MKRISIMAAVVVVALATMPATAWAKKPPPFDARITYTDVIDTLARGSVVSCPDPSLPTGPVFALGSSFESRGWTVVANRPCPPADQFGTISLDAFDGTVGAVAYTSQKLRSAAARGAKAPGFPFLVGYFFGRYIVVIDSHAKPSLITAFVHAMAAQQKASKAFDIR